MASQGEDPNFVVILEKKGRARGALSLTRPWAVRTFRLHKQKLEYYDGEKLKGDLNTKNSVAKKLKSQDCDGKEYPFELRIADGEQLLLNASGEEIRERCIDIFNRSSKDINWDLSPTAPAEIKAYEDAATKAVVGSMAADAEKKRLEAEAKKLEEERLKQATEKTSAMFEEEAANSKLRAAQAAEEKQREEQERQIMESFKGMGAKLRFRSALDKGFMRQAKEAAAEMLQNAWRAKVARRKMEAKRAEKEHLKMMGYAKKIQCRYRARLARKKIEKIKAEKLAIKQKLAALKVQCAWRIFIARKRYREKLNSKAVAEYNRQIARSRGLIVCQSKLRKFISAQRVNKLRIGYPYLLKVAVKSVEDEMSYSSSSSEPTALVSGMVLTIPPDSPELHTPKKEVTEEMLNAQGKLTSLFHCKPLEADKPETAIATALNRLDYVVVTMVDTSSTAKGDLIGQAFIRLLDVPHLNYGNSVELTVPLGKLKKTIVNTAGEQLVFSRRAIQGTVTVELTRPAPAYSMCGWMWKESESMLSSAWKKRWFTLVDGALAYCNHDLGIEQQKQIVPCASVTGISEESHKGHDAALKISFKRPDGGADDFWFLDFDEDESPKVKNMWKRVLFRACKQLPDPTLVALGRDRDKVDGETSTAESTSARSGKVPMRKRMSVFS